MSDRFVLALIERQERDNLSNRAFAKLLGVDASYWSRVRREDRKAGRPLIRGAMRIAPELAPLLVPVVPTGTDDGAN